jgi:hypothetical protein
MDIAALKNQGAGLARGGLWFAAGFTVGKGILDGDTAVTIAGAILTMAGGGLTTLAHTNSSIVKAFTQIPEVKSLTIADEKLGEVAKEVAKNTEPPTRVNVKPEEKKENPE